MNAPKIVAEGEHVRCTPRGIVVVGEFSRPVEAACSTCSYREPLRLIADDLLDDAECDRVLTEYLEGFGWDCRDDGDVCPECVKANQ